jgi:hypothetical protein
MAKLKVFCWSDGFHAYPVAVSSRSKALEAWGVSQDLFKTGMAVELTEGADFAAALESPGQVLERKITIKVDGPVAKTKRRARKPEPEPKAVVREAPKGPTKAQVARAGKLEAALRALDTSQARERKAAETAVTRAEAVLDKARADERTLTAGHRKAREAAEEALAEARDALRG